jgi:hypothetical protein
MDHLFLGLGRSIVCCVFADGSMHLFQLLAGEGEEEASNEAAVCCLRE